MTCFDPKIEFLKIRHYSKTTLYLYENASLERFVSQSIVKLLALLTKYGWLEQDPSQVVTDDKMAKILNKNRDKNEVEGGMEGGNENNNNSQTNNTDTSNSKSTDTANKSKFPYRRIVDEVQAKFFNFNAPNHTINHASVGCQILTAIITEINTGTGLVFLKNMVCLKIWILAELPVFGSETAIFMSKK